MFQVGNVLFKIQHYSPIVQWEFLSLAAKIIIHDATTNRFILTPDLNLTQYIRMPLISTLICRNLRIGCVISL